MNAAFKLLEAKAVAGERCPFSDQIPGGSPAVSTQAHLGRIRVEIFAQNFRRVTILVGPNKGKHTANPPLRDGHLPNPYLVVDGTGTRRNGVLLNTGTSSRMQPSAPRDYSKGL